MASKHGRHVSYMGGLSRWHHSKSLPHLQIHSEGIEPWLRVNSTRQRSQSFQCPGSWTDAQPPHSRSQATQQGGNRALCSSGLSLVKGGHCPIRVFHHGCLGGGIMVENAWPCGIAWLFKRNFPTPRGSCRPVSSFFTFSTSVCSIFSPFDMALLGGSLFFTKWSSVVNRQSLEPQSARQYGIMNTYKIIWSKHKMQFICAYMATGIHQVQQAQHAHQTNRRELHGNATTYLGLS